MKKLERNLDKKLRINFNLYGVDAIIAYKDYYNFKLIAKDPFIISRVYVENFINITDDLFEFEYLLNRLINDSK
jgi:hypothetical protein